MFSRHSKYVRDGLIPISIASKAPKWYTGLEYLKLAPKWSFLREYKQGKISKFEYKDSYNLLVLSDLSPTEVVNDLCDLLKNNELYSDSANNNIVLLCYEVTTDFCHRQLVVDWFKNSDCSEICQGEFVTSDYYRMHDE